MYRKTATALWIALCLCLGGTVAWAQDDAEVKEGVEATLNAMLSAAVAADPEALNETIHDSLAACIVDDMGGLHFMTSENFANTCIEMAAMAPPDIEYVAEELEVHDLVVYAKGAVSVPNEAEIDAWAILVKQGDEYDVVSFALDLTGPSPAADRDAAETELATLFEEMMDATEGGLLTGMLEYLSPEACVLGVQMGPQFMAIAGKDQIEAIFANMGAMTPDEFTTANEGITVTSRLAWGIMDTHIKMAMMELDLRTLALLAKTPDGWRAFAAVLAPLETEEAPE